MKRRPDTPRTKGVEHPLNETASAGLSRILIADEGEETFTLEQIRRARG